MAVPGLSPQQIYQYQNERNQYGQGLLKSKAQNVYQQQLGNMQLGRDTRNFNTQWDQKRTQLPTNYLQRGIGRSGIYQGALQSYARDRTRGLSDLLLNNQMQQAGMVFQDRGYEDDYANQMTQNYGRQFASQAELAAALRGIL